MFPGFRTRTKRIAPVGLPMDVEKSAVARFRGFNDPGRQAKDR